MLTAKILWQDMTIRGWNCSTWLYNGSVWSWVHTRQGRIG